MIKEKKNVAVYDHFMRITDENIIEKIRNIDEDSDSLTPETLFEIAQLLNIDITYKELCESN